MRRRDAGRRAAVVVAFALAAAWATACSGGSSGGGGAARERPLRVAMGQDLTASGVRQDLIRAAARDAHLGDVDIVELPDDTDRQRSQLVAALQAGNQDGYDIVVLDATWTAEFARLGLIEPLDGNLDVRKAAAYEDVWRPVRRAVEYDGRAWAVPWNADVGLLYYRADLLPADETLRSWSALEEEAGGRRPEKGLKAGMVTQLMSYEGLTVNAYEAVWRHGGEIVGPDGRVRVGEQAARDGLGELNKALNKEPGSSGLPMVSGDSLMSDETGSTERFLAGEALTMRSWPFARLPLEEHLKKTRDSGAEDAPEYGVTALPEGPGGKGPAVLGGQNLAVSAGGRRGDAARGLIAELTDAESAKKLYAKGFVPAHESAIGERGCDADRDAWSLPERPPKGSLEEQYRETLCWSMEHARARPSTPYYAAVSRDVQEVVGRGLREYAGIDIGELKRRLAKSLRGE